MAKNTIPLAPDVDPCDQVGHDHQTLRLYEARARILSGIVPVTERETVPLRQGLGRVLASPVTSAVDVPSHTNSAMDGYALAGQELPADGEKSFEVVGTSWAGRPFAGDLAAGQCVRIMTGASLPAGTDTVIMQEHVAAHDQQARIAAGHRTGQHVRKAGEDIRAGAVALEAGALLQPAHIGLIASIGVGEIEVLRRPRVAIFSTGDELRSIGEPLGEGQIYDSNRYTLGGMLTRLGLDVLDMGVIRDTREDTERAFAQASRQADAILASGGVSVGEADFVTETLERIGRVGFWKVAMKPGKPIAFGHVGQALFFGLPGNPVSVMATFYQIVQPALRVLMGITDAEPPLLVSAICRSRLKKKAGRLEFQRGVLSRDADTRRYVVTGVSHQGAGVLRSMTEANCFIVLPLEQEDVQPGEEVQVQPFAGLV
jgi:molybdopterin molybdotransferase